MIDRKIEPTNQTKVDREKNKRGQFWKVPNREILENIS